MYSSDYRRIARERLDSNWKVSILTGLVAVMLGGGISGVVNFNWNINERITDVHPALAHILALITGIVSLLALAQFIIGGTVQLGYARYLLKQQDSGELKLQDLFSQFHRFGDGFIQAFLRNLYIILWTFLFIIPGLIKTFSYAMTPFIMADYPELTPSEAITASRELMDGHKSDLFLLGLSFIGWDLLSLLTLGILNLWIIPYKNAAYAAFYRNLVSNRHMDAE